MPLAVVDHKDYESTKKIFHQLSLLEGSYIVC